MSTLVAPALLVIDLQALPLGNSKTMPADQLLRSVAALIGAFRDAGLPVVYAVSTGTPVGRTSSAESGRNWSTEQAYIAPEVKPLETEIVVRRAAWSAFAGTGLAELLRDLNVTTTVVVGLATPFGIESTAHDAYDAGFTVVVPTDAIAAPELTAHEWTINRVIPLLGTTALSEDITESIKD
ncbi:MAG: isochorismatase family cysteine hydrolase [Rhodoglobus sp.]